MAKSPGKEKKAPQAAAEKPAKAGKTAKPGKKLLRKLAAVPAPPLLALGPSSAVLDRLYAVVLSRKGGDVTTSHSARLLARGRAKVAQKFGEEAVECLIEAVRGDRAALIGESADVLYHMLVMWVDAGIEPGEVWTELQRREGISGIAEKAARTQDVRLAFGVKSTKIP